MRVSTHMVRALVSAVECAGGSREHLLARSAIASEQLDGPDAWLSVCDYMRILETAVEVSEDPALGLHFGERATSGVFQLLAHLVEHAATLGEALEMIVRYTALLAQGFEPEVILEAEHALLRFPWLCGDSPAVCVMAELAMSGLMRLLRLYVGQHARGVSVSFAYREPACAADYRRVFGRGTHFEQPFTQLQFPRAWLARTQLYANPELQRSLVLQADRELALQHSDRFSARVEQSLARHEPRALPNVTAIARELGMSSRTLLRRLRSEGVTFTELILKHRSSEARRLLEPGALSVREVAEAMGFADTPAFHKAFKRWTGLTPMQYVSSVRRGSVEATRDRGSQNNFRSLTGGGNQ